MSKIIIHKKMNFPKKTSYDKIKKEEKLVNNQLVFVQCNSFTEVINMSLLLYAAVLLLLLPLFFFKWATRNNNYFAKRAIAHGKPKFLLGTSYELVKKKASLYEYVQNWYNRFPNEKYVLKTKFV